MKKEIMKKEIMKIFKFIEDDEEILEIQNRGAYLRVDTQRPDFLLGKKGVSFISRYFNYDEKLNLLLFKDVRLDFVEE